MTKKSTEDIIKEVQVILDGGHKTEAATFLLNCLSGVPFGGGAFSATAGLLSSLNQTKINEMLLSLSKLSDEKIKQLENSLFEINNPKHCVAGFIKFNPNSTEIIESSKVSSITDNGPLNYTINLTAPIKNYIFNYYGSEKVNISKVEEYGHGLSIVFETPCPDLVSLIFYEK